MSTEQRWWWLSFADDDGFRGLVILEAPGFIAAVEKSRELGINPGGQVRGLEIPPHGMHLFPEKYRNRLLPRATAFALSELEAAEEAPCN